MIVKRLYHIIKDAEFAQKMHFTILHILRGDIILSAWIFPDEKGRSPKNNFGDDINLPIIKSLTGRNCVLKHATLYVNVENLLCIGSIIEGFTDKNSIIWGSGVMHGRDIMQCKPKTVLAVRGPLTRKDLLLRGIDCPEIYGDPALLLPLIYRPSVKKKYKYGIVPHYVDFDLEHVKRFRKDNPEVLFIKMQGYDSWESVIDQICSCEAIASSSLHGLIVSDAYHIPNTRVRFSTLIEGGDFKYQDYFSSVNRENTPPLDFTNSISLQLIETSLKNYKTISFDVKPLLSVFPYRLSPEFKRLLCERPTVFI